MVVFSFTQGGQIRLVDPAGTAQAFVVASDALAEEVPAIARGGLDPVADAVSWTSFARRDPGPARQAEGPPDGPRRSWPRIGPIYSDEILWEAGLRHDRISSELSSPGDPPPVPGPRRDPARGRQAPRHHASTTTPSSTSTASRATTRTSCKVYGREGEPCRRCRAPVAKARFANRPLYFCEACQV